MDFDKEEKLKPVFVFIIMRFYSVKQ